MTDYIKKGDPINPKALENILSTKFKDILTSIANLIPLGFNALYNITASKTFNIRPKIQNPNYSTRSGSDQNALSADTSQPNIGASFLGTPWTLGLAQDFGVHNNSILAIGSYLEPFPRITPKVPFNPVTDLLSGAGIPLPGNSPFLTRGFLGLSNWFEDANLRLSVDETGGTLAIKAKQLSLFSPYRESENTYTDEIYKQGFRFLKPIPDIDLTVDCTGLSVGDYLVYAVGTAGTNSIELTSGDISIRFQDATDLSTDYGVTWSGDWSGSDPDGYVRYERPLAVAHSNGTGLETSNVTAWEETIGTNTNADPKYTKQYQQCSSSDISSTLQTQTNDRRLIPAWYYLNNDNNTLIDSVTYNGITRDIPGAGGNKVTISSIGSNYLSQSNISVYVDQCELTNGTDSLWIKNLPLSTSDIAFIVGDWEDPDQSRGLYVWLAATPDHNSTFAAEGTNQRLTEGYSLDYRVVLHSSPTWLSDPTTGNSGVTKSETLGNFWQKDNTYRCRIGWIPTKGEYYYIDTFIVDGHHSFPGVNRFSSSLGAGLTIGTGTTPDGDYQEVSLNTCRLLPLWGNNLIGGSAAYTEVACTSIDIEAWNSTGTRSDEENWVGVATTTTGFTGTGGTNGDIWLSSINTDSLSTLNMNSTLAVGTSDKLYYAGTGADGGSYWDKSLKMALIKGFYLPYSYK